MIKLAPCLCGSPITCKCGALAIRLQGRYYWARDPCGDAIRKVFDGMEIIVPVVQKKKDG